MCRQVKTKRQQTAVLNVYNIFLYGAGRTGVRPLQDC